MIDAIFKMYQTIDLGRNAICLKCKINSESKELWPVSIWNVGSKFHHDQHKILFVGKTAVDDPGELVGDILDARSEAKKYFLNRISNLWNYLNLICKDLYGSPEEGWEHIAMTNMVKCNQLRGNGAANDTTPGARKDYCLKELGVFWRELEILKPRKVIFLTGWNFGDDYIDAYRIGDRNSDVQDRTHTIMMGNKEIPWWHRKYYEAGQVCQEFLRTGHPERIQKEAFIVNILSWIKFQPE